MQHAKSHNHCPHKNNKKINNLPKINGRKTIITKNNNLLEIKGRITMIDNLDVNKDGVVLAVM